MYLISSQGWICVKVTAIFWLAFIWLFFIQFRMTCLNTFSFFSEFYINEKRSSQGGKYENLPAVSTWGKFNLVVLLLRTSAKLSSNLALILKIVFLWRWLNWIYPRFWEHFSDAKFKKWLNFLIWAKSKNYYLLCYSVEIFIIFKMHNIFCVLISARMMKIQLIMPVLLQKILDW